MAALLGRPKKTYLLLAVAIVLFFALSAVGHTGTTAENEASSVGWIGSLGWAGFLLSLLGVLVYSVALLAHRVLVRRPSEPQSTPLLEERS